MREKLLLSCLAALFSFALVVGSISAAPSISDSAIPDGYEVVKVYPNSNSLQANIPYNDKLKNLELLPEVVNNDTGKEVAFQTIKKNVRPLYDLRNTTTGEIVTQYSADVAILATTQTKSTEGYDKTSSVLAKATIYCTLSGSAAEEYMNLDKVVWSYEITDSSVKIKSKSHKFIQNGPTSNGHANQTKTLNPSAFSGTDNVNWGWKPINTLSTVTL
ncbi:hypothetical protein [Paenibacillus apiarius]|uniref:hypothetical protein n=1 Tax=Paenibacillus apiarius TaxID=46240 RepID=UPI003B3A1E10